MTPAVDAADVVDFVADGNVLAPGVGGLIFLTGAGLGGLVFLLGTGLGGFVVLEETVVGAAGLTMVGVISFGPFSAFVSILFVFSPSFF